MKTHLLCTTLALATLLSGAPLGAADFGGAVLEIGIGSRALSMGSAFAAVADDATAPYWNPAGIIRTKGKVFQASGQRLSLDRHHDSISFALNLRRELGFGMPWLHAGVKNIQGREFDGRPRGEIEDATNAYFVAVGRALGPRLALGVTMKIINQTMTSASSKGNAFDLGLQFHLNAKTTLAGVVRNLGTAELDWKVERGAEQTSSSSSKLTRVLILGASQRPFKNLLLAADFHTSAFDSHANIGAELQIGPVLTLRCGLNRLAGAAYRTGSFTAGLTLRPMRRDTLRLFYTFASDELGAGGRTALAIALQF